MFAFIDVCRSFGEIRNVTVPALYFASLNVNKFDRTAAIRAFPVAYYRKGAKGIEHVRCKRMHPKIFCNGLAYIRHILRAGCDQNGFAPIVGCILNDARVYKVLAKFLRNFGCGFDFGKVGQFPRNPQQVFINLEFHNGSRKTARAGSYGPGCPGPVN